MRRTTTPELSVTGFNFGGSRHKELDVDQTTRVEEESRGEMRSTVQFVVVTGQLLRLL